MSSDGIESGAIWRDGGEPTACAYPDDESGGACGEPCRRGSSYCAVHHALCHIPGGSAAERRRLREAEALAKAVGGRRGRTAKQPPANFLRRLERAARGFSR